MSVFQPVKALSDSDPEPAPPVKAGWVTNYELEIHKYPTNLLFAQNVTCHLDQHDRMLLNDSWRCCLFPSLTRERLLVQRRKVRVQLPRPRQKFSRKQRRNPSKQLGQRRMMMKTMRSQLWNVRLWSALPLLMKKKKVQKRKRLHARYKNKILKVWFFVYSVAMYCISSCMLQVTNPMPPCLGYISTRQQRCTRWSLTRNKSFRRGSFYLQLFRCFGLLRYFTFSFLPSGWWLGIGWCYAGEMQRNCCEGLTSFCCSC